MMSRDTVMRNIISGFPWEKETLADSHSHSFSGAPFKWHSFKREPQQEKEQGTRPPPPPRRTRKRLPCPVYGSPEGRGAASDIPSLVEAPP